MKRVSFEVAKAIKEAGYPQDIEDTVYLNNGETYTFDDENPLFKYVPNCCCDAPTYLDVWLWLWREKKSAISLLCDELTNEWYVSAEKLTGDIGSFTEQVFFKDPEDAIIAAIEYLIDNDLIK